MRRARQSRSEFSRKRNAIKVLEGTSMAQAPTRVELSEQQEQRTAEKTDKEKLQGIVIDLGRPQSPKQVRRLRKGRGKLMRRIEEIVDDLAATGTVKAAAQPIIIIVRERVPVPWPFGAMVNDLDNDED